MNLYVIAAILASFVLYTVGVYEYGAHRERASIDAAADKAALKETKRTGAITADVTTHVGDNNTQLQTEIPDVRQQIKSVFDNSCAVPVAGVRSAASVQSPAAAAKRNAPAQGDVALSSNATSSGASGNSEAPRQPLTVAVITDNLEAGAANTVSCAGLQEWVARICADGRCDAPAD